MKLPDSPCPRCKTLLNGAVSLEGHDVPREGDASVCIACGELLMYDSELRAVLLSVERFCELGSDAHTEILVMLVTRPGRLP